MSSRFLNWLTNDPIPHMFVLGAACGALVSLALGSWSLFLLFATYTAILIQSRLPFSRWIRGFPGAPFVRRVLRTLFLFIPLPFLGLPPGNASWPGLLVGLAFGVLLLIIRLPEIRLNLAADMIAIFPPLSRSEKLRDIYHFLMSAIGQEYYYRGVVITLFSSLCGIWAIGIAALLFIIEHYVQDNSVADWDWKDYSLQTMLSLGSGMIYYFTGSLVGSILAHIVYNTPGIMHVMRRKNE